MTRAVDVRVVALLRLVLHVRDVNSDPALPLLGRLVDHVVCREIRPLLRRKILRDRRCQRRLAEEIAKINPSFVLIYEREMNTLLPILKSGLFPF